MSLRTSPLFAAAALMVAGALWSFNGVLLKSIAWGAIAVVGMRSAISLLAQTVFLTVAFRKVDRLTVTQALTKVFAEAFLTWKVSHWLGAFTFATNIVLLSFAFRLTASTNAVFLHFAGVALVAFLSWPVLGQRPAASNLKGGALSVVGMAFIVADGLSGETLGTILGILCGLTMAGTQLCLGRISKDEARPYGGVSACMLADTMLVLFAAWDMIATWRQPGPVDWLLLALLGTVAWVIPNVVYVRNIRNVPVFRALLLAMFDPVLTPVWCFLALGEMPRDKAVIGAGVIALAVVYQGWAQASRSAEEAKLARKAA